MLALNDGSALFHEPHWPHLIMLAVMLVALQKVEQETIDDLKQIFHSLDTNGNGILDRGDLLDRNMEKMSELARLGISSDKVSSSRSSRERNIERTYEKVSNGNDVAKS